MVDATAFLRLNLRPNIAKNKRISRRIKWNSEILYRMFDLSLLAAVATTNSTTTGDAAKAY